LTIYNVIYVIAAKYRKQNYSLKKGARVFILLIAIPSQMFSAILWQDNHICDSKKNSSLKFMQTEVSYAVCYVIASAEIVLLDMINSNYVEQCLGRLVHFMTLAVLECQKSVLL